MALKRQSTKDAGIIAGLNVLYFLSLINQQVLLMG